MKQEVMYLGKNSFFSHKANRNYFTIEVRFDGQVATFFLEESIYNSINIPEYSRVNLLLKLSVFRGNARIDVTGLEVIK